MLRSLRSLRRPPSTPEKWTFQLWLDTRIDITAPLGDDGSDTTAHSCSVVASATTSTVHHYVATSVVWRELVRLLDDPALLEAELEAIETAAEERERYLRIAETLESFRERLRAGAASLDVIERQKVLRSLVKEVLVDEGEITIRHSIPLTESGSPSHGKPAADLPQRNPKPQSYLLRWGRHRGALWRPLSSPVAPGSCDACRPPRPAPAFLPFCPSQKSQKLTSKLTSIYTNCVKKSQKWTSTVDFIDKLCETLDVVTRLGGEGPLGLHSVVGGLS